MRGNYGTTARQGHFEKRAYAPGPVWVSGNEDRDSSGDERPGAPAQEPGDYDFPNLKAGQDMAAIVRTGRKESLEDSAKHFTPRQLFSMWLVSRFQR